MNRKLAFVGTLLIVVFVATFGARAASKDLNITPRIQETSEWCWLTVGQMVFEHYRIPAVNPRSFQCGIVAAFAGPQSVCWRDCRSCPFPAGNFQNITGMLDIYPKAVNFLTRNTVSPITSILGNLPLSKSQIKAELDNNRPVIVGISPSGFPHMVSEHVALIVGYDENTNGNLILTINDPFPYDAPNFARLGNPYNRARAIDNADGSYIANYDSFKNGLIWQESIYGIKPLNLPGRGIENNSGDREYKIEACMEKRPAACIDVCVNSYGNTVSVCRDRMCRSEDPVNQKSWRTLCERQVDRELRRQR